MASDPLMEDEFKDRDSTGLEQLTDKTGTEDAETTKYIKMLLVVMPIFGQVLAWIAYFFGAKLCGQQEIYAKKFALVHEYELGYVFLCLWVICYTRSAVVCIANGARAPARVGRPDQHVYKVMASSGSMKDAPYVMMATTGPQGRFNRAQRGVFNMDESGPYLMANIVAASSIFGPLVLVLCVLVAYGRVTFARKYKNSLKERTAGFMPAMIGEKWIEGLVLLCAIKGIFNLSV